MEKDIHEKYKKFLANQATAKEIKELLSEFEDLEHNSLKDLLEESLLSELDNSSLDAKGEETILRMQHALQKRMFPKRYLWKRLLPYAAAAVIVFAVGLGLFNTYKQYLKSDQYNLAAIGPGGNRATLVINDSINIELDTRMEGIQISQSEWKYNDGSSIPALDGLLRSIGNKPVHFKLHTPNGGQYQVQLPDGTNVFLNSASILSYSLPFGSGNRIVHLSGEAFFDVTKKGKDHPFLVKTHSQTVEVLGTKFAISSYRESEVVKTTLLEGEVRIIPSQPDLNRITLQPGQQALVSADKITQKYVEPSSSIAWKEGFFEFDGTNSEEIINAISKWYNIKVEYNHNDKPIDFVGQIPKNLNLDEFIKILEFSNIKTTVVKKDGVLQKIIIN